MLEEEGGGGGLPGIDGQVERRRAKVVGGVDHLLVEFDESLHDATIAAGAVVSSLWKAG